MGLPVNCSDMSLLSQVVFPCIRRSAVREFNSPFAAAIVMSPPPFVTKVTHPQAHEEGIWSVKWSRSRDEESRQRIVSGSIDDTVKAWVWTEDETLELKCIFEGHSLGVVSVDISNDGRYAVSSSLDCHIRFWDLDNGAPAQDMAEKIDAGPTDSWTVCFSPDTSLVATGCQGGKINLFSTETGKLVKKLDTTAKFALSVAFSPDGKYLATGAIDGIVKIFEVETSKLVQTIEAHAMPIRALSFSHDSQTVVTGSDDCHLKIFEIGTENPICSFSGHGSWILCADYSPDGEHLASSSADRTVRLWDIKQRTCVQTCNAHTDQVWSCSFNDDGTRLISGSDDASLIVYGTS